MQPDGAIDNKEEVKSDEDLPAYCDPPNPCPIGVVSDDCDPRSYEIFTAQYSKDYQEQQNCMCDDDHNECHKRSKNGTPADRVSDLITNLNVRISQPIKGITHFFLTKINSFGTRTNQLTRKGFI